MRSCVACTNPLEPSAAGGPRRYCDRCRTLKNRLSSVATGYVIAATGRGCMAHAREYKCVDCGAQAAVYDHRDYFEPFNVEPVCRSCNHKRGPATDLIGGVQHFEVSA